MWGKSVTKHDQSKPCRSAFVAATKDPVKWYCLYEVLNEEGTIEREENHFPDWFCLWYLLCNDIIR